jgi:radical SAM protein with 4Fe4S-binding SPASM domain
MKIATGKYMGYGLVHSSSRVSKWESTKDEKYHHYRAEWVRRPLEMDAGNGPLSLNVEVTTRCNLACTFCTNTSLSLEQIGDLDFELYTTVVEELSRNCNLQAVNLNGLGEPLLRKDFLDFIKLAKDFGLSDIMFHTNGTTLTKEVVNDLVNSGVDKVIVSVDSPNKANYEKMRLLKSSFDRHKLNNLSLVKGFSHERLIQNTEYLIRTATQNDSISPLVRTTCVLTKQTIDEMPEFLEMWKNFGADQITFQDLMWRDKILDEGNWKNAEENILQDEFDVIKQRAIDSGVGFVCPQLYQATWINFNGDIVPCSNPDARKHMVMGNLGNQTMQDIWLGMPYRSLRDLHQSGRWHEHPICGKCEEPLVRLYKYFSQDHTVKNIEVIED